jgi:hypothetical protein
MKKSMIVEITGIPGVGKSTLFAKASERIQNRVILFSEDMVLKRFNAHLLMNPLLKRLIADLVLFATFLRHRDKYKEFLFIAAKTALSVKESLPFRLNIIRNLILKFGRYEFIRKTYQDQIIICDEGVSHIPFNLIDYSGRKRLDVEDVLRRLSSVLGKINVILLERDAHEVQQSLKQRGHKRVSKNSAYSLEQFVKYNHLLVQNYKSAPEDIFRSRSHILLSSDGERNVETFISALKKCVAMEAHYCRDLEISLGRQR